METIVDYASGVRLSGTYIRDGTRVTNVDVRGNVPDFMHDATVGPATGGAGLPFAAAPGHTLHRELELYVEAGLTPLEALATATSTPARVMGVDAQVGAIAAGMVADLVLVDGRPDDDIRALRRIRTVMRSGRLWDPAALWKAVDFKP